MEETEAMLVQKRLESTQLHKQPDVLLFLYLFRDEFNLETIRVNYRYYEPRCTHQSSLSPPIHAALAAFIGDTEQAELYLRESYAVDLRKTGEEGIHAATLAGLWQAVTYGFAGTGGIGHA